MTHKELLGATCKAVPTRLGIARGGGKKALSWMSLGYAER
jgi:hypothetical protein